jgi:glucoamylase
VWDAKDLPDKLLFNGHPAGSGMPLVVERATASFQIWTPDQQRGWVESGKDLRVDLGEAASVTWEVDGKSAIEHTVDSSLGIHYATIPTKALWGVSSVVCGVHYASENKKNRDISFTVTVR